MSPEFNIINTKMISQCLLAAAKYNCSFYRNANN